MTIAIQIAAAAVAVALVGFCVYLLMTARSRREALEEADRQVREVEDAAARALTLEHAEREKREWEASYLKLDPRPQPDPDDPDTVELRDGSGRVVARYSSKLPRLPWEEQG